MRFLTISAVGVLLVAQGAAAQPAAPARVMVAEAADGLCVNGLRSIDRQMKQMAEIAASAVEPDDSAPRATMRAAQTQALVGQIGATLSQLQASKCPLPTLPIDDGVYRKSALRCATAVRYSAPNYRALCDYAKWRPWSDPVD